ncbi:MAG: hypothetical protein R3230_01560 [Nitrosopumilaceae archaeon]|nr:hypothetical protein [Nitrosopumilaceae archaeon]
MPDKLRFENNEKKLFIWLKTAYFIRQNLQYGREWIAHVESSDWLKEREQPGLTDYSQTFII